MAQGNNRMRPLSAAAAVLAIVIVLPVLLVGGLMLFTSLRLTHRAALPLETTLGNATVLLTVHWHAGSAKNPNSPNAGTLALGQTAFRTCVQCHGAAGDGRSDLGSMLYPPGANFLASPATSMTDPELFWVIKNGLSFTAMPAYKTQYRDDAVWSLVDYIRALQQGRAIAFGPPLTSESATDRASRRVSFQLTDSSLQPATATAQAGTVEMALANRGAQGHSIVVSSSGKVPYNAGRLLPTETSQLEGKLDPGDYVIAVDPSSASPGPTATLTVR